MFLFVFIIAGFVSIQPRPTTTNTTTADPNIVILVESDDETGNDTSSTMPK